MMVRLTGMTTQSGTAGVEFLEYEAPEASHPMSQDSSQTDFWHWAGRVTARDVDAATRSFYPQTACVLKTGVAIA